MAEIKGVFFDLGGTLRIARHVPEHEQAARLNMARLAGETDVEAFMRKIDARYAVYREWALGNSREAGDYELWAKWLTPEMPEARLREICHEATYQYRQASGLREIVPGGMQVLNALKDRGFRLGIISNLIGENEIFDWLKADHLDGYFDSVTLSSVCHIRKPDPEIYLMGCREIGLKPENCLSVADKLDRDIVGGIRAGIGINVLFISPEKLAKKTVDDHNRPDYIVHRFTDILSIPQLQERSATNES